MLLLICHTVKHKNKNEYSVEVKMNILAKDQWEMCFLIHSIISLGISPMNVYFML